MHSIVKEVFFEWIQTPCWTVCISGSHDFVILDLTSDKNDGKYRKNSHCFYFPTLEISCSQIKDHQMNFDRWRLSLPILELYAQQVMIIEWVISLCKWCHCWKNSLQKELKAFGPRLCLIYLTKILIVMKKWNIQTTSSSDQCYDITKQCKSIQQNSYDLEVCERLF